MPQTNNSLTAPTLKNTSLNRYLDLELNQVFYDFYHEYAKDKLNLQLNLKDFFDEVYNYAGVFYLNFEKTPFEVIDFFDKIFEQNENQEVVLLSMKQEFIYLLSFYITKPIEKNVNREKQINGSTNRENYYKIWKKMNKRIGLRNKIKFENNSSELIFDFFYNHWLKEFYNPRLKECDLTRDFFLSLFYETEIKSDCKKTEIFQNFGSWKISDLEVVELGKAIFEQQKPEGITQTQFINNLGKLFNYNLTRDLQNERLKTIKRRQKDETKFIDELSGFLHTYLNK